MQTLIFNKECCILGYICDVISNCHHHFSTRDRATYKGEWAAVLPNRTVQNNDTLPVVKHRSKQTIN